VLTARKGSACGRNEEYQQKFYSKIRRRHFADLYNNWQDIKTGLTAITLDITNW
jgi:hypothetical protein